MRYSQLDMESEFATSVEMQMILFQSVVNCIKGIREEHNINQNDITPIEIYLSNKVQKFWFDVHGYGIAAFVKGPTAFLDGPATKKQGVIVEVIPNSLGPVEVHVDLRALTNSNIDEEIAMHIKEINKLDAMLNNSAFMSRASATLVLKKKSARDSLVESVARLEEIKKSSMKKP